MTQIRIPRSHTRPRGVAWVYVVASLVLGFVVPRVHGGALGWVNPALGQDQVIAFLSAVSSGMMAFTGIVFSLLFILLQLGSSAYTPHLVPMLASNRVIAHAGGVFTGTFLYSLMALRGVGAHGGETTALTVWTAFVWLLGSVYLLLRLVGVFSSLTITGVLDMLGDAGEREIDRLYGNRESNDGASAPEPRGVPSRGHGRRSIMHRGRPQYLVGLDVGALTRLAREGDTVIRIPVGIGDSVSAGTELASFDGSLVPEERVRSAILLGRDRSLEQGPKQAMRLLVDIAIRALSPAVNDPTTAVHSLDQIEALLVRLGESRLDIGRVTDPSGALRLEHAVPTWEEYLELGVTEIQQYGASSVQVERRLAALLALLTKRLPPARRPAVERFAHRRLSIVRDAFPDGPLREQCERLDWQGLGHARPEV